MTKHFLGNETLFFLSNSWLTRLEDTLTPPPPPGILEIMQGRAGQHMGLGSKPRFPNKIRRILIQVLYLLKKGLPFYPINLEN